ncbi:MAG: hypothetical protein ACFCU1_03035 [Sumerlaeia bacterium]
MLQEQLELEISKTAEEFNRWAAKHAVIFDGSFQDVVKIDGLLLELSGQITDQEQRTRTLNAAASYLGILVQGHFQGEWCEHEIFGICLNQLKGIEGLVFSPKHLVEKKSALREELSLERILGSLPRRIEAVESDRSRFPYESTSAEELLTRYSDSSTPLAVRFSLIAQEFTAHWEQRFRKPLTRSLVGAKELDIFLKSQYFVFSCDHLLLQHMGIFIGEIARGLYGGQWTLESTSGVSDLKLVYPELALSPLGKIYKTLSKQAEDESLEEYLRLIPSAREELRKRLN